VRLCVLAAGTKNLKDHRNLLLERRAIVARHSVLAARTQDTNQASFFVYQDCYSAAPQRLQDVKPASPRLAFWACYTRGGRGFFVVSVRRALRGGGRPVK